MIPAQQAHIEWAEGDKLRIVQAVISDRSDPLPTLVRRQLRDGRDCARVGWVEARADLTPEAVFMTMIETGFASNAVLLQVLREFGKIESCGWARAMAADLELPLAAEPDGQA